MVLKFLNDPNVRPHLAATMDAMGSIDEEHFEILSNAFGRIRAANLPKIEASLQRLNITLASFLTDPTIFIAFLKDQEATQILLTVQALLPTFDPSVLNSMLTVKQAFDDTPGANKVLEGVFQLPLPVMMKLISTRVRKEKIKINPQQVFYLIKRLICS